MRTTRGFTRAAVGVVGALCLLAAGCGDDGDVAAGNDGGAADAGAVVSISDAWSRQPAQGQSATAVYGVVTNPTDEDLTILAASSPVTDQVELHETVMDDDGVMQMQEREEGFVVPAGGAFVFEPGGPHIMLLGIDADTYPDPVEVTIEFDNGDPLSFNAEVRAIAGDSGMEHTDDMDHGDGAGEDDSNTSTGHDHGASDTMQDEESKSDTGHDHGDGALDVSALHEVDEQLAAGTLNAEAQQAVVADYISAVKAMEPAAGSAEAELLAALQELEAALAAGKLALAAPLAADAHTIAHDLGHGHGS